MGNLLFSVSFSRFHSKLRLEMNQTKVSPKFFNEKFRKQFHLFTCIFPDYMGHESLKAFWKNSHIENMRADILRQCQN